MDIYKRVNLLRRQQFLGFMNSSKKMYYAWNKKRDRKREDKHT